MNEPCTHPNFAATVDVARITETEGGPIVAYMADVRIRCAECGEPFRFLGVPFGLSYTGPMLSVDGLELRAPIAPQGEQTAVETGAFKGAFGFTIRQGDGGIVQ